jgi:glycosyltransferase involved in cell wall biosynthesis
METAPARWDYPTKVLWIGGCNEIQNIYNAFDLHTLCSPSEGRASVVAESMACGVPCVVTDVGDNARVTGKSGIVVEPGDPQALAKAWHAMLIRIAEEGAALSREVRQQVMSEPSFEVLAARTTEALISIPR